MRWTRSLVGPALVIGAVCMGASDVQAQVLGTFRWRMEPYCNVVTLTAVQQGPIVQVTGFDDNCGLGGKDPVTGGVFLDGGAAVGNLTIVDGNGGTSTARFSISLASLSGSWVDNARHQGNFIFSPAAAPGSPRPPAGALWGYVVSSGTGFHASSGGLEVTHPATGEYCIVLDRRRSWKGAQATLADPGGDKVVSVGTGHGSACNPLSDEDHAAVPVYVRTVGGALVDGNFTIVIPGS